jgi:peroxidase
MAATAPKTMPSSVFAAALLLLAAAACEASPYYPLELGYYRYTCPQAEAIVKASMEKAIAQNPGNGAAVIRMLFHDCFVEVFIYFICVCVCACACACACVHNTYPSCVLLYI